MDLVGTEFKSKIVFFQRFPLHISNVITNANSTARGSAGLEFGGPWAKLISRALFPLFSRDFLYQQARHSKDAEKILF
jgi:hypothetical protein